MNLNFKMLFCLAALFSAQLVSSQLKKTFKVVIDAGHGGEDPGAVNKNLGLKEKDIALDVCLKTEKILSNQEDIEVFLTRKSDFFIPVYQRAEIANKQKADLFLSVHLNSSTNTAPFGTETFVMGLSKSNSNLEVVKNENSVISLEKDYKTKYEGFDPSSPESMIGLTLLQEQFMDQSVRLASKLQYQYTKNLERYNRGVKQDVFLVLHKVAMPSVLTELGFLSNDDEALYMNSEIGKEKLALAIANAILDYKKEFFKNNINEINNIDNEKSNKIETKNKDTIKSNDLDKKGSIKDTRINKNEIIFKVQIRSSDKKLKQKDPFFKSNPVTEFIENNFYKYYYFETNSIQDAKLKLTEAKKKGYSDAFIVGFKNGKRINIDEYKK